MSSAKHATDEQALSYQPHGPPGTNNGGTWYWKNTKAVGCGSREMIYAILCCDVSILCAMCIPLTKAYAYKDPVTDKCINGKGHQVPTANYVDRLTDPAVLKELFKRFGGTAAPAAAPVTAAPETELMMDDDRD